MAGDDRVAAWRRKFLRELARSGSVAMAAERAGIDRTSAYQLRKRNAVFAASWARAQAAAREALAGAVGEGDASASPGANGGSESGGGRGTPARLRLRPNECVRGSKDGRPCIVRAGPGRWSAEAERAFIEELTASANVKAAARAAGVSTVAVYNRRKNWPEFAAAWREALAAGYVRIETLLLGAATVALDPEPEPASRDAPEMTVEQAMNLLRLHRASQHGGRPQRYAWREREPDIEEVRAEILRRAAAIERQRAARAE